MTISIEQAQLKLAELIQKSSQGEKVVITTDGVAAVELVPVSRPPRRPGFGALRGIVRIISDDDQDKRRRREPGFAKDVLRIISDDDEHLKDFAPYME